MTSGPADGLSEGAGTLRQETIARVPGRLAPLIERRVEQLLGLAGDATTMPPDLDDAERSAIDVCEQFVLDVHGITDDQMATLRTFYSDADVVAIMFHLALTDGFTKLDKVDVEGLVTPAEATGE